MALQPRPATARPPVVARRAFIAGLGSLALVAGCSGGGAAGTATGGDDGAIDDLLLLQPGFADGLRVPSMLAAGTAIRAPFFLFGGGGGPAVNGLPDALDAELTLPDGSVLPVEMPRHDAGIPTPYFLLSYADALEGRHELRTTVSGETQTAEFLVAPRADVGLAHVGQPMPVVDTPTFDDARGYDPICTRFDPCPFHDRNLADVVGNGRPTALLVATPGYCQTAICGPSVELLMELDVDPRIDVVHAEVYLAPGEVNDTGTFGEVGPVITTYGMTFEPSFVVADAAGLVTARLDFTFDRVEMAAALASV